MYCVDVNRVSITSARPLQEDVSQVSWVIKRVLWYIKRLAILLKERKENCHSSFVRHMACDVWSSLLHAVHHIGWIEATPHWACFWALTMMLLYTIITVTLISSTVWPSPPHFITVFCSWRSMRSKVWDCSGNIRSTPWRRNVLRPTTPGLRQVTIDRHLLILGYFPIPVHGVCVR